MARISKVKKYKVIRNPELVQEVKGFVPVFGSAEDLDIVNKLFLLDAKLETVDNGILRGGDKKKLTTKMKQIQFQERHLINSINRRNLDF